MISRRKMSVMLAGLAALHPLGMFAQVRHRPARIGFLKLAQTPLDDAFRRGLKEQGYIEGENLVVEHRAYGAGEGKLAEVARELVQLKPDVIFGPGPPAAKALSAATRDVPVVVLDLETDPIEAGFAASLAQPGGNVTGVLGLSMRC